MIKNRDEIPEKIAVSSRHTVDGMASQIELYQNCPGADFALSGTTHHWLIIQHEAGPEEMLIETEGKERSLSNLGSDQIIYIPPFQKTKWSFSKVKGCTHILIPDSILAEVTQELEPLDRLYSRGEMIGERANHLCRLVHRQYGEACVEGASSILKSQQLIYDVTEGLLTMVSEKPLPPDRSYHSNINSLFDKMRKLKDYMWENLGTSILLQDLATVVGMSIYHFARCFKEIMGVTPHRYLTCMRIQKSRILLFKEQNLAIVAALCGFADQAHFTRVFKSLLGMTPLQYKKATSW